MKQKKIKSILRLNKETITNLNLIRGGMPSDEAEHALWDISSENKDPQTNCIANPNNTEQQSNRACMDNNHR